MIGVQDFEKAKIYKPTWTKIGLRPIFVLRWNKRKLDPDSNSQDENGGHSKSHPCSDSSDDEIQTQTQLEDLDDKSILPDPIALAQNLFMYWQQYLNFHEDMENTESDTFAQATLNELSILVSENSTSTGMEEAME